MLSLKPNGFARIAAAGVCLAGVLVLVGWTFDIATLKSVLPDWPRMTPVTALAFILSGIVLGCRAVAIPGETTNGDPGTRQNFSRCPKPALGCWCCWACSSWPIIL